MPFITKQGLKELDNYKYIGGAYSWLDNQLNGFWIAMANLLPNTMAPNTVTFIGFIIMISSYSLMLFYDTTLQQDIPSWLFLKAGIDIILYQTLDAMDGKQARRTNSSRLISLLYQSFQSPLGQLFDHGCDSFSLAFFMLLSAQACKLDINMIFYLFICSQLTLFVSNWVEYHTHVLHTQFCNFGVTEGELIVSGLQFVAFFKGQGFWRMKNSDVMPTAIYSILSEYAEEYSLAKSFLQNNLADNIAVTVILIQVSLSVLAIAGTIFKTKKGLIDAILQFIPLVICVCVEFIWFHSQMYTRFAGVILLAFGTLFSLITCKLIISSLTKMDFKYFHAEIFPYAVLTLVLYYYEKSIDQQVIVYLFSAVYIFTIIRGILFFKGTIKQITDYLGIYCFSIQKKAAKKDI